VQFYGAIINITERFTVHLYWKAG